MARTSAVGIGDGTISPKDFQAITRRSPPYLRAALMRFKRATDDAEASSDGRWQQHNRDIATRHKLKAAVLNAEYDLREAKPQHRPAFEAPLAGIGRRALRAAVMFAVRARGRAIPLSRAYPTASTSSRRKR